MTGGPRGRRLVGGVLVLAAGLLGLAAITGRAPFLSRDGAASALSAAGLPRDLPAHLDHLDVLELPGGVADLGWLEPGLGGLSIDLVDAETLRRLPANLRSLEVRRSSSLPSLGGLPPGLQRLSLAHSTLEALGPLPDSLRELSLSGVKDFEIRALPRGLERLELRNTIVVDLRGSPAALDAVSLEGRGITNLDGMPEGVRLLSLRYTYVSSLRPLPANLHALELAGNPLLDPLADGDLPRFLVELGLEQQNLSALKRLPVSLRRLRVSGCRRSECAAARAFLRALPSTLSHLEVVGVSLPDGSDGCWFPPGLSSLALEPGLRFDAACLPTSLKELSLTVADAETVGALSLALEKLAIIGPADAGLGDLATVPDGLRHLTLDHTLSDLQGLRDGAPALTTLRYRGSPLEALPALPASLEVLDLSGSSSLRSLGPLGERNGALRVLLVGGSQIASLADVPASVRELDISGTAIQKLEGLPHELVKLTISRRRDQGGIESLRGLPRTVRHLSIVD
ncbi:MAG: hypothetical protein ACREKH_06740 [Candidatus Rokuibacteriota bacterium]